MKKIVRLNESDIRRIVKKSIKNILREMNESGRFSSFNEEMRFVDDMYDHEGPAGWVSQNDKEWDAVNNYVRQKWSANGRDFSSFNEEMRFVDDMYDHEGPAGWVSQNDKEWDAVNNYVRQKWGVH